MLSPVRKPDGRLYEKLVILSVLTDDVPETDESNGEGRGMGHGVTESRRAMVHGGALDIRR